MNVAVGSLRRLWLKGRFCRPGFCLAVPVVLLLPGAVWAGGVDSFARLEVVEPGESCGCHPSQFGARAEATEGYDGSPLDEMIGFRDVNEGYAAVYHEQNGDWSGPTGFYQRDQRPAPPDGGSKTWLIYLWVLDSYPHDQIEIATDGRFIREGSFKLRLDVVPEGVVGAPAVGTEWDLPNDRSLAITLPTYRTSDGKTGYQFTLTMIMDGSTNPPCCPLAAAPVVFMLLSGMWLMTRSRR